MVTTFHMPCLEHMANPIASSQVSQIGGERDWPGHFKGTGLQGVAGSLLINATYSDLRALTSDLTYGLNRPPLSRGNRNHSPSAHGRVQSVRPDWRARGGMTKLQGLDPGRGCDLSTVFRSPGPLKAGKAETLQGMQTPIIYGVG